MLYVKPFTKFFEFEHLNSVQLLVAISIGIVSVTWYELVKLWKRHTNLKTI